MANTTHMIVDSQDYFVAHIDDGGVRVGLCGEASVDLPAGHQMYAAALACKTSDDAEVIFDSVWGS